MARKGKNTLDTILKEEEENSPVVTDANIGAAPQGNEALKEVYDKMHHEGPGAWFDDGAEERELILKMGEPWSDGYGGLEVLEIGCGEGWLSELIATRTVKVTGIDYSEEAIKKAKLREKHFLMFECINYRDINFRFDRIVMQGVLEHLDNPFVELKWMMDNLLVDGGDVITSSPMFVNPRGFVWMALHAVGAVMSKTDLHFLNPWDFEGFCKDNGYSLKWTSCNHSWANGVRMIEDFRKRLPLALRDGGIHIDVNKLAELFRWLAGSGPMIELGSNLGATAVYRISK